MIVIAQGYDVQDVYTSHGNKLKQATPVYHILDYTNTYEMLFSLTAPNDEASPYLDLLEIALKSAHLYTSLKIVV